MRMRAYCSCENSDRLCLTPECANCTKKSFFIFSLINISLISSMPSLLEKLGCCIVHLPSFTQNALNSSTSDTMKVSANCATSVRIAASSSRSLSRFFFERSAFFLFSLHRINIYAEAIHVVKMA